ncbi:hypothetical protein U1Q18_004936 [Sarracenia purpurea var. burkii]
MDFYNLTRRELQNLCKKNKIPANTTNIAMADALKALEIVEGMEEFLKPSESETAHSSVESPCVPRTGCTTSTRRKPIKEEHESSQILSRTRRGSRRANAGDGEDTITKLDVYETPAAMTSTQKRAPITFARLKMETPLKTEAKDMKNVPETPAAATARRRETVASARRKMETSANLEEASVRQVYSTRRSTRLLEKTMTGLNLNDDERTEPIRLDASDKKISKDPERNVKEAEFEGMHQKTVSDDDLFVKTDEFEALSDKQFKGLSESVRELEDNIQGCAGDTREVDYSKVKRDQISEVFDESDMVLASVERTDKLTMICDKDVNDEVHGGIEDDGNDSLTKTAGIGCERYGESNILSGENLEKSQGQKHENPGKEGCYDFGSNTFLLDIENTTQYLASENGEEFNADENVGLKDSAVVIPSAKDSITDLVAPQSSFMQKANDSKSEEATVDDVESECSSKTGFDTWTQSVFTASEHQKLDIEPQNKASKESDMNYVKDQNGVDYVPELNYVQGLEVGPATEEPSDDKASLDDVETELEEEFEAQYLKSALIAEDMSKGKVVIDDAETDDKVILDDELNYVQGLEVGPATEEPSDDKASLDDVETELEEAFEAQSLKSTLIAEDMSKGKVLIDDAETDDKVILDDEKAPLDDAETELEEEFETQDFDESTLIGEDKSKGKVLSDNTEVDSIGSKQLMNEEAIAPEILNGGEESDQPAIESSNDDGPEYEKFATIESPIQVAITEDAISTVISQNASVDQLASKSSTNSSIFMASTNPSTYMSSAKTPGLVIHSAEVAVDIPFSTLAADPLQGQMPSSLSHLGFDSDHISCPAPNSNQKNNNILDDDKKENIDYSGEKLDLSRGKEKEYKDGTVELFNDETSLRQLRKIFKKKLQIREEKNIVKVGRPALQTLSENRLAASQTENETGNENEKWW